METWLTVNTFTYPHEAHLAKSYLESEGIEVNLKDEFTVQANNFFSNAIGGVKVQVMEDDFVKSKQALINGGYINTEGIKRNEKIQSFLFKNGGKRELCPYCNSDNIEKKKDPSVIMIILYFFIGALLPFFKLTYGCYDCNKEWKFIKK